MPRYHKFDVGYRLIPCAQMDTCWISLRKKKTKNNSTIFHLAGDTSKGEELKLAKFAHCRPGSDRSGETPQIFPWDPCVTSTLLSEKSLVGGSGHRQVKFPPLEFHSPVQIYQFSINVVKKVYNLWFWLDILTVNCYSSRNNDYGNMKSAMCLPETDGLLDFSSPAWGEGASSAVYSNGSY